MIDILELYECFESGMKSRSFDASFDFIEEWNICHDHVMCCWTGIVALRITYD